MKKVLTLLFLTTFFWANAKTEPIEIQGAVGKLRGVLTTPDNFNQKKIPVVLLCASTSTDTGKAMATSRK